MKNQEKKQKQLLTDKKTEKGNALVIILVAIVLLAGLTFTVMRSENKGDQSILSKSELKFTALEILNYGQSLEDAVTRVRNFNGCSDREINFNISGLSYHNNTLAPGDGSCDIFKTQGGGLTQGPLGEPLSGKISGRVSIEGMGTGAPDLVYFNYLNSSKLDICNQINKELGITYSTSQPPADRTANSNMHPFRNPYIYSGGTKPSLWIGEAYNGLEADAAIFAGRKSGCFTHGNSGSDYSFYHVLLVR